MTTEIGSTSTQQPVALVTGANKGLGQQIAKELVAHGYLVLVGSGNFENGKKAANEIHYTPNYLSDMLRSLTGQNAQQHIHQKLIERSKDLLSTTNMTINEVAYKLGFEYPQSFSRLFKSKTKKSPAQFRSTFN